jgi:hypothetical protein
MPLSMARSRFHQDSRSLIRGDGGDTAFGFETGELDETSVVAYQVVLD